MRKIRSIFIVALAMVVSIAFSAVDASAALFKLEFDNGSSVSLGGRMQVYLKFTDENIEPPSTDFESTSNFQVRRARIRLAGKTANGMMGFFLQTDVSGNTMITVDRYMTLKLGPSLNFYIGQHLAAGTRQSMGSSAARLTIGYTPQVTKTLTWGLRSLSRHFTTTVGDTDAGGVPGTGTSVRDTGVTVWGNINTSDTMHIKYYLGIYDGVQTGVEGAGRNDNFHYAGRLTLNFGDAEAGYYNLDTFIGKKDIIAIGVTFDTQNEIVKGRTNPENGRLSEVDYNLFSADLHVEKAGLTFEVGFTTLDLDEEKSDTKLSRATGRGWYAEAGYLVTPKIQPWVLIDTWESEHPDDVGSYTAWRVGATYFMEGHRANFKIGYESFNSDKNFSDTTEDTINTVTLAMYMTF